MSPPASSAAERSADEQTAVAGGRADAAADVKFHLSLNVTDLDSAVRFYRTLFGIEPAKHYPQYAKFELNQPPLVMSLEPTPHAAGGALNHLGFRVSDAAALVAMQHRLELAGMATDREDGVECCHARQTKFWVRDPDRNMWELYVVEADIDPCDPGASATHGQHIRSTDPGAQNASPVTTLSSELAWEHQLGQPFPDSIFEGGQKADQVFLRGTFNEVLPSDERRRILAEVFGVLRQGGRITIHGLVADRAVGSHPLRLPGPAAAVQYVPTMEEMTGSLLAAGFRAVRLSKLSAAPVFRHEGIGLREMLLEGSKLDVSSFDLRQVVLYQGPLRQITDDFGNVFCRGERAVISTPAVEALRAGPLAGSFVFFPPGADQ